MRDAWRMGRNCRVGARCEEQRLGTAAGAVTLSSSWTKAALGRSHRGSLMMRYGVQTAVQRCLGRDASPGRHTRRAIVVGPAVGTGER